MPKVTNERKPVASTAEETTNEKTPHHVKMFPTYCGWRRLRLKGNPFTQGMVLPSLYP
jgi:hypothetical protein